MSAQDREVTPGARVKSSVNNVRVLGAFERGYYLHYRNCVQMCRSPGIFAQRIAEYLTKEPMPAEPLSRVAPVKSAIPNNANSPATPPAYQPPVFQLSPVAWSMKVVNLESSFPPQLREEVIVLVRFTPEYFRDNAFANGTWVLAHLRNSIDQGGCDIPGENFYPSDSRGRWNIALTPELLDHGPPESSRVRKTANVRSYIARPAVERISGTAYSPGSDHNPFKSLSLRKTANVRCYHARPSVEQISEFVYSTDFGNNDIYSHTSVSDRMDVEVLQVVLYPGYAKLADALRAGLTAETIARRKAAYQESFRRAGINPSRLPRP